MLENYKKFAEYNLTMRDSICLGSHWLHFYWHGLTLIPVRISNQMPSKVWDEITYLFLNFDVQPLKFGIW